MSDYVEKSLPMRVTYDAEADATYIQVATAIADGEATRQVECDLGDTEGTVILDFNNEGRLLGVEILGASVLLPNNLLIELTVNTNRP